MDAPGPSGTLHARPFHKAPLFVIGQPCDLKGPRTIALRLPKTQRFGTLLLTAGLPAPEMPLPDHKTRIPSAHIRISACELFKSRLPLFRCDPDPVRCRV